MKRLLLALVALSFLPIAQAHHARGILSATPEQYKWNPGYYGLSYNQPLGNGDDPTSSYLGEVSLVNAAAPTVKGYTVFVNWAGLETGEGNYQFAGCTNPNTQTGCNTSYPLDQILNQLRSNGQHAILVIMWGAYEGGTNAGPSLTSSSIVPNYVLTNSAYGAGVTGSAPCSSATLTPGTYGFYIQSGGNGFSANITNTAVLARWDALGQALAEVYDNDPVLEGVIFIAMDVNYPCVGGSAAGDAYYDSVEEAIASWKAYFKHTSVGIQVAFDTGGNAMETFTEWLVTNGGIVSASDTPAASMWQSIWSQNNCTSNGDGFSGTPTGTSGTIASSGEWSCFSSNSSTPYNLTFSTGQVVSAVATQGSGSISWTPSVTGSPSTSFAFNLMPLSLSAGLSAWTGNVPVGSGWTLPSPLLMTYSSAWTLVEPMDLCGPWYNTYFTPTDEINAANTYLQDSHLSVIIFQSGECNANPSAIWNGTGGTVDAMESNRLTNTAYPSIY